jgi:hypothetical protein
MKGRLGRQPWPLGGQLVRGSPGTRRRGRTQSARAAADERSAILLVRLRLDAGDRFAGTVGIAAVDVEPLSFDGWLEFMLAVEELRKRLA